MSSLTRRLALVLVLRCLCVLLTLLWGSMITLKFFGPALVFSPAKVIFAGIGCLPFGEHPIYSSQADRSDVQGLIGCQGCCGEQRHSAELFERIGFFFNRLETYTEVRPTAAMTNIITKIMVEVLTIFGIATKELRRGSTKKFLKKLAGMTDLEDAVKNLDRLTQEEARMALAEVLKITHIVHDGVKVVDGKVESMDDKGRRHGRQSRRHGRQVRRRE
ncbi:hypothetical protein EDB84DRAFT_1447237 [Lactarius hengduanensis]|nr:hypothetical protein EDB84DRAFT_1447237 [Lactarius hengduanensis]